MTDMIEVFNKTDYNYLLSHDIIPDWCCWPFRKESQILAESLGFALYKTIPAHIWNIEMK